MRRRIMSWLFPSLVSGPDPRIEAAIARNLLAQQRAGAASDGAAEAAADNRESVLAAVDGLKQRTQTRRAGPRGYGRRMADSALEQMADRVKRELGDDHDP